MNRSALEIKFACVNKAHLLKWQCLPTAFVLYEKISHKSARVLKNGCKERHCLLNQTDSDNADNAGIISSTFPVLGTGLKLISPQDTRNLYYLVFMS